MNEENTQPEPANDQPEGNSAAAEPAAEPAKKKGWEMPEPKFQQTSGYLPQGFLDEVSEAGGFSPKPGITSIEPQVSPVHQPNQPEKLPDDFSDVPAPGEVEAAVNEDEAEFAEVFAAEEFTEETESAAEPAQLDIMPEPEPVPDVEPQPEIYEEPVQTASVSVAPVDTNKKSGLAGTLLFVLFFVGMSILALAIIAIAYYLFLAETPAGRTF